jgi:3',5'-cyclic AMP phosphodiesterase CpdA
VTDGVSRSAGWAGAGNKVASDLAQDVPDERDEEANGTFVLAHLSDPHVPTRLRRASRGLLSKRLFGYLSWRLRRIHIHRAEVLDALVRDLQRTRPDHVAVTGDIVNIAQPHEFERSAVWLRRLGAPHDVTIVPGNHDAYVGLSWERSWAAWTDFLTSDDRADPVAASCSDDAFPVVRRRGPTVLIGLSTAVPTAPGHASGRIGPAQMEQLADRLRSAGEAGLFRIVLLHHPPRAAEIPRHKRLLDARGFERVIGEAGSELILHGHEHRYRLEELAGPVGSVPCFGVPSASMLPRADGSSAQYHLHRIDRRQGGWRLRTEVYTYSPQHAAFVETCRLERLLTSATGDPGTSSASSPGSTAACRV